MTASGGSVRDDQLAFYPFKNTLPVIRCPVYIQGYLLDLTIGRY